MSHTTAIKGIMIQNIAALRATIEELNEKGIKCSLLENEIPRAYYQNQQGLGKADFVIKLDAARYDIGLYKNDAGAYEARTDFWGGDVAKILGGKASAPEHQEQSQLGKLFQTYGIQAATMEARRQGKMVRRVTNEETGDIKLVLTGF